ncbi:hypothetical protein L195_g031313 [Trifolium pratense]|uniref:Uncharacterized protein n=1 Tax=Trifolium pratense TaxID=57577 RepID=A0A2K3LA16_TRIPR|nr:hypothetical protein L195_g031313 [Trifolium pratense]
MMGQNGIQELAKNQTKCGVGCFYASIGTGLKLDLPCKEMQRWWCWCWGGSGGVGIVVRAASWVMIASTLSLSSSKRSAFVRAMKVKRMRAPNC